MRMQGCMPCMKVGKYVCSMYVGRHVCMYVCRCVCMYVCMYVCMFICENLSSSYNLSSSAAAQTRCHIDILRKAVEVPSSNQTLAR